MKKNGVFAAFLCFAAPMAAEAQTILHACVSRSARSVDVRSCLFDDYRRQDNVLNIAYQCIKRNAPADYFTGLQQRQREWIKERDSECALDENGGTMALDIRASCLHEKVLKQADLLTHLARGFGCTIPNADSIPLDLEHWNEDLNGASVSTLEESRLTMECRSSLALLYGTALEVSERTTAVFRDAREGETVLHLGSASKQGNFVYFTVDQRFLSALRAGSSTRIWTTDPNDSVEFSLRGSSNALAACTLSDQRSSWIHIPEAGNTGDEISGTRTLQDILDYRYRLK